MKATYLSTALKANRSILHTYRRQTDFPLALPPLYPQRQCRRTIAIHTFPHQADALSVLPTNVDKTSPEYKENAAQMDELMARMHELHKKIEQGGPEKSKEKHVGRGKMLPRE